MLWLGLHTKNTGFGLRKEHVWLKIPVPVLVTKNMAGDVPSSCKTQCFPSPEMDPDKCFPQKYPVACTSAV